MATDHDDQPIRDGRWWIFTDGTVLPVVSGGAGDDGGDGDESGDEPPEGDGDPDDGSGSGEGEGDDGGDEQDPAKLAAALKRATKDADRNRRLRGQAEAKLAELQQSQQTDAEKALSDARAEGKAEADKAANARIVRAEVKAAAAKRLADPADAVRFLDLDEFEVGDDGEVDGDAIAAALDALLEAKPYLGVNAPTPKPPPGDGDGGARGGGGGQLTAADVAKMTPHQIVEARKAGKLDHLLSS